MTKCIYCLKDETETIFTTREHVVPQFMGTFYTLAPVKQELLFEKDHVCTICNNETLSKTEGLFRSDSWEGFAISFYNVPSSVPRGSFRMRNKRFQFKISGTKEMGHYSKMMPRIVSSGKVAYHPGFAILHSNSQSYHFFWLEETKYKYGSSSKRKGFIHDLKAYDKKGILLLYSDEETKNELILFLHDCGITYTEKEEQSAPSFIEEDKIFIDTTDLMDIDTLRFPAKLAYNYFAYCMLLSGFKDQLLSPQFQDIRNFILRKDNDQYKYIQPTIPVLHDEKAGVPGRLSYQVVFEENNGHIVGIVSLLGVKHYMVTLGLYNFFTDPIVFGNGHNFDPFTQEASKLTTAPIPKISSSQFSIFNR